MALSLEPQLPKDAFLEKINKFFDGVSTDDFIRALLCFIMVIPMLYLQWQSVDDGKVPAELISIAGVAAGFYLTSDASHFMKAVLSVMFVGTDVAFCLKHGWVPESVTGQVSTIIGVYFGKRSAITVVPTLPIVEKQNNQ